MKKISAILLLLLLLFNWFGYRLLISFMEDRADMQLVAQLDENRYIESQLISVKVPTIHFSGYIHSGAFERMDGQIEIKGIMYNYVKRKLYDDSLELMCIPNRVAMKLRAAKDDFFELINDLQHNGNKKAGSDLSKNISADYVVVSHLLTWNNISFITPRWRTCFTEALSSYYSTPIENPPEKNRATLNSI